MIVPVFPLPGAFLFPGAVMPLHVFEDRYRTMVEDLLDTAGRLVITSISVAASAENTSRPELDRVAGLGEITRHEKLPDGRYVIVVFGLQRVVIDEVPSDRPYRCVEADPLDEVIVPDELESDLKAKLERAVTNRADGDLDLPDELDVKTLTDLLLMQLSLPPTVMSRLFAERSMADRARGALAEHGKRDRDGPPSNA